MSRTLFCHCGELRAGKSPRCAEHQRQSVAESRKNRLALGVSKSETYGYKTRKENLANYIFQSAKQSAKKRGIEFNLEKEDITIPENCPVFGTPFLNELREGRNPRAPSIDRIDSAKGYIKGNIQIISWRANFLKSNGTKEEFKLLTEFLYA